MAHIEYDEFGLFHENAAEWDMVLNAPPTVARVAVDVGDGRAVSALRWGADDASLALVHGGAQNAHTWDTVALALDRSLVAVDLPGHGHSDGPAGGLDPSSMATDVARAIEELAAPPVVLVGMSLGGLTSLCLAADRPELVAHLVLVDITPGVNAAKASHITEFINGPPGFESFDDLLERTIAFNPTRSVESLRRGILHNAVQLDDGTWTWRWARHRDTTTRPIEAPDARDLWRAVEEIPAPITLLRGMAAGSVVDDDDVAELRRRRPDAEVIEVHDAGHSIQGDQPIVLAAEVARHHRCSSPLP
jgi:pimeloyl-ACP methyl ester carboxylesterase